MPRYPRDMSNTGIYHVMIRGINKMHLFQDEYDKNRFLETLTKMKKKKEFILFAYCIMDNHAHLLLKEGLESISDSMKRICVSYSYYYNNKYNRIGHVFQDRFKSEKIENDEYLLECIRYIHNNPIKASMVSSPGSYKFSSYYIYTNENVDKLELITKEFPLSILSEEHTHALKRFKEFSNELEGKNFIDIDGNEEQTYKDQLKVIENILSKYNLTIENFSTCRNVTKRDLVLGHIKKCTNIPITEISKILGISKYIIYRA